MADVFVDSSLLNFESSHVLSATQETWQVLYLQPYWEYVPTEVLSKYLSLSVGDLVAVLLHACVKELLVVV